MTANPLRAKALAILREGRCTVLHARYDAGTLTVPEVIAHVRSSREHGIVYAVDLARVRSSREHGETYAVDLTDRWTCTCRASEHCAHILAVAMVTGHAGGAS